MHQGFGARVFVIAALAMPACMSEPEAPPRDTSTQARLTDDATTGAEVHDERTLDLGPPAIIERSSADIVQELVAQQRAPIEPSEWRDQVHGVARQAYGTDEHWRILGDLRDASIVGYYYVISTTNIDRFGTMGENVRLAQFIGFDSAMSWRPRPQPNTTNLRFLVATVPVALSDGTTAELLVESPGTNVEGWAFARADDLAFGVFEANVTIPDLTLFPEIL